MAENNSSGIRKGRGGARPGAGRKPGSKSKLNREIAEKVAATGITPLEIIVEAMRDAYKKDGAAAAVPYAEKAAPYMHARIAAVEVSGEVRATITDEPMSGDDWKTTYAANLGAAAGTAESTG